MRRSEQLYELERIAKEALEKITNLQRLDIDITDPEIPDIEKDDLFEAWYENMSDLHELTYDLYEKTEKASNLGGGD